jgi:hypothetical protein
MKKSILNQNERLQLSRMIKENNVEDMTEKIRKVRHSSKMNKDANKFAELKKKYSRVNKKTFTEICQTQCEFIYNNYTEMFYKLVNDNLDINLFKDFIKILKEIEDGILDYHEGSYKIGSILKKIYIDSVVNNRENTTSNPKKKTSVNKVKISWKQYKLQNK